MNGITPVALVPVRDPRRGKTRLSPVLEARERAALVGGMLADVVASLGGAGIDRIVVLAAGDDAAAAARALGVDVLLDPPGDRGIDAAITAAGRRVRAPASLVVPADLALLQPDDVRELVAEPGDVVVAPTSDAGTGGLLRRPAWVVPTAFGAHSAARHLLAARQAGLSAERVDIEGFVLDVDEPADLEVAIASPRLGRVTRRIVDGIGDLADRLARHRAATAGAGGLSA